ncbi:2-hydroxychromene-2-carboxylate isomerase [Apiospora hydei]|uniref:2-hydroxychromene-2-carboxylate isomerase n=1 Tax=Apiospora hydei TaxID=1337664 RepID=A0ABR1XAG5_9PEZI
MVAAPSIRLYVDVVSPFAYQAFHILRHDPVFKGVKVEYIPIFLGGLMHACGNTAPIQIKNPAYKQAFHAIHPAQLIYHPLHLQTLHDSHTPAANAHATDKDKWIGQERLRWARAFGVPMSDTTPANFPPNTLHTMRAVCALSLQDQDQNQDKLVRGLETLFAAMWTDHAEIAKPDVFGPLLVKALGEETAKKALADAATVGKAALKENTDKAFADGAFGLPWMVCTNRQGQTEGFWGVDHMGQVLQFMQLERPREGGWKSVL